MLKEKKNQIAMGVVILVLIILPSIKDISFLSIENLRDISINATYVFIACTGMLLIILSGEIDVSVGANLAISGAVAGILAKAGMPAIVIFAGALFAGAILGFINGFFIAYFKIQAIIVTLATMSIFRGMFIITTGGKWITSLPNSIVQFGTGSFLGLPIPIIMVILIFILAYYMLNYLPFGRNIYSIGSNSSAARLAGIPIQKMQILVYTLSGALFGTAALIYAGRYGSVQSNTGLGFEMILIAAVIVGGTNINGGSGTITGTLLGSILITMISTVLIFFGISAFWEEAIQGLFILLAVLYYTLISDKELKEKKKTGYKHESA